MNRYGLMAREHWARWLPARYAAIENPDRFFTDLGNQVAGRIDQLGAPAGRLGQARHQAEEIVLTEMVLLPPEPGADEPENAEGG